MGQQQLLLVILVTIIVGIATVVAINTFSSASDTANVDAVRQDLLSMSAAAQQFYMKPEALGGGGQDFGGITMRDMSFAGNINGDLTASNQNGNYEIPSAPADGASSFTINATPATAGGLISVEIFADSTAMGSYDPDGTEVSF
jgi:Tfp pilus assembly protein PilE